jgi:small subunit ribosomal protein S20
MAEDKTKKERKPRRPTALKRDMQNEKRRLANRSFKAQVNTAVRSVETSLKKGEKTNLKEKLSEVFSLIDKGVKTGVFSMNKAGRDKSRLAKRAQASL